MDASSTSAVSHRGPSGKVSAWLPAQGFAVVSCKPSILDLADGLGGVPGHGFERGGQAMDGAACQGGGRTRRMRAVAAELAGEASPFQRASHFNWFRFSALRYRRLNGRSWRGVGWPLRLPVTR